MVKMKKPIALLCVIALIFTGCVGQPAEYEPTPAIDPSEAVTLIEPPNIFETQEMGPYWWTPPQKPTPEMAADMDFWQRQFEWIHFAYPWEYIWDTTWNDDWPPIHSLPQLINRDGILLQLGRDEQGHALLSSEDFRLLVALYFGPEVTAENLPDDFAEIRMGIRGAWPDIEYRDGRFNIPMIDQQIGTWVNIRFEFVEVIALAENLERVELRAHTYISLGDERVHEATHRYILRWSGAVGYIAEEISWEYAPTDRVVITGDVRKFPSLWGREPDGFPIGNTVGYVSEFGMRNAPLHVSGEDVFRLYIEDDKLLYDRINLETFEQVTGQALFDFEASETRGLNRTENGFVIVTDDALHHLDSQLRLQNQVARPERWGIINAQFTQTAFVVEHRLYLLDLEPSAEPRLLYTFTPCEDEPEPQVETIFPDRFVESGHLWVGVTGWDAIATRYLLFDQSGNRLAEVDWHVAGALGGGYSHSTAAGAFHTEGSFSPYWEYFNFDTLTLTQLQSIHFPFDDTSTRNMAQHSLSSRHGWYFSVPRGNHLLPDETAFYFVNFANDAATELSLHVYGARASLIAVSESGRVLFNYAHLGERGFGVYTPDSLAAG